MNHTSLRIAGWGASGLGLVALFSCLVSVDLIAVSGPSMETTMRNGDVVIMLRASAFRFVPFGRNIGRGQVVVFRAPFDPNILIVKRVLARGGEELRIDHGTLIVNDIAQNESYVTNRSSASWPFFQGPSGPQTVFVPYHHYFVLGDNRENTLDSRAWGAVPESAIVGISLGVVRR